MKTYSTILSSLFSVFVLLGCGRGTHTTVMHLDSIMLNKHLYYLDSISEKEFMEKKYKFPQFADTSESDTSRIIYTPNQITLITEGNEKVNFKSKDSSVVYSLAMDLVTLNSWLVIADYGSWQSYFMVNHTSGKTIVLWEKPLASPNREYFACFSNNLLDPDKINGIQLFRNTRGLIEQVFEFNPSGWKPVEMKWKDNETIIIKRTFLEAHASTHSDYVEMKVLGFQ